MIRKLRPEHSRSAGTGPIKCLPASSLILTSTPAMGRTRQRLVLPGFLLAVQPADLVFVVARSGNCIGRYRSLKQRPEVRTQMQFFTLLVEQAARVSGSLQGVEQVRKPHKPHRRFEVIFAADVKSGPAGVGNRAVFFGKTLRQKRVANWTRKGYINDASSVQVPDLRTSETEFSASKPVRVDR